MTFSHYIKALFEETTSGDIAQVPSKLGGPAAKVQKRPKTFKVRNPDDDIGDESKEKEDYEDLKPDNIKSAAVVKQIEDDEEESKENKKKASLLPKK